MRAPTSDASRRYTGTMVHFFFQAEDGIRGLTVTGVQTCALPISRRLSREPLLDVFGVEQRLTGETARSIYDAIAERLARSEERRVGKEWRSGWSWAQCREKITRTGSVA